MAFEWNDIHGLEENYESKIIDDVEATVTQYYGVDEVTELTREQINEIEHFKTEVLEDWSVMQVGFSSLISWWEGQQG